VARYGSRWTDADSGRRRQDMVFVEIGWVDRPAGRFPGRVEILQCVPLAVKSVARHGLKFAGRKAAGATIPARWIHERSRF
jgi:hypothetical protein